MCMKKVGKMRLWLDDIRPAPSGWMHVKTVPEAISILETVQVGEISLDNDLGFGLDEGVALLDWMEKELRISGRMPPKIIHIHTGDVHAERHMLVVRDRIYELVAKQTKKP